MNHLTRSDYAGALRLLARLEAESGDLERFAQAAVAAVGEFVASDLTTLSVCDLVTGHYAEYYRRGLDFDERDRERLELLRPHLAFLYRQACGAAAPSQPDPPPAGLTQREGAVMHWLARGKTDADIAALLSISPRTVHKHLEHIYVKLGVETRTAAVMRVLGMRRPDGRTGPLGISFVRPPIASPTRPAADHPSSAGISRQESATPGAWRERRHPPGMSRCPRPPARDARG